MEREALAQNKLKFGIYQFQVSLIVILTSSIVPVLILIMPMMQRRPDFFFKDSDNQIQEIDKIEFCKNTYYSSSFDEIYDKIVIDYTNIDNWAADLKLVCNTRLIFSLVSTVYFLGSIASNLGFSKVPDNYGRRKIFIILNFISALATFQLCFLYHFSQIIISSFMLGLTSQNMSIGSIILNETLEKEYSGLVMGIANAMFPLTGILNTVLVYYFGNWRIFFFFMCIVSILNCILSIFYLKETTKWLKDNGKNKKYIRTMRYIVNLNGNKREKDELEIYLVNNFGVLDDKELNITISASETDNEIYISNYNLIEIKFNELDISFENRNSYDIIDLFYYKSLRWISIVMFYVWVVSGFSFYGLLLNLENLTGNIFIDSIVSYSGEFFAEVYSGYLANIYGKKVLVYSFLISFFSCISFDFSENIYFKIIFLFLASIGISSAFNLLYIFSPQYYPTNIKSLSGSFFLLSNRIAAGLVPLFLTISDNVVLVIGLLSGIAVILVQYLPEVLNYNSGSEVNEKIIKKKFPKMRNQGHH